MNKLFQFCLVFCALSFASTTIAVKNVKSTVLADQEKESLSNYITTELEKVSGHATVMAWSDVAAMLTHLGQANSVASLADDSQELECLTDKCFEELGGALGIDRILVTDIGKFDSSLIVNMRVINLTKASAEKRASRRVDGGVSKVLDVIPVLLKELGYEARLDVESFSYKENEDEGRRQKAAKTAVEKADLEESKTNKNWSPWLRYTGLVVASVGGGLAYWANEEMAEWNKKGLDLASQNENFSLEAPDVKTALKESEDAGSLRNLGYGILGTGLLSFGISFAF